jgi:asparagine synthase (glutamine-hydrolysing)
MCGIFGFVGKKYTKSQYDLVMMKDSLLHRGPDHFDFFTQVFLDSELNFGHVRLSIIDVSTAGGQPMHSKTGRYVIVFNGEIYNYREIKKEVETHNPLIEWVGNSDTEVLLAGIELFGLHSCVSKLVGMFAFSLWDKDEKVLYLVRDRIGEKPLYYGYQNDQLVFSSELNAIERHSKFEKVLNREAAVGYLLRGYIPANTSIYENIFKVNPGTILEFKLDVIEKREKATSFEYWSLADIVDKAKLKPYQGSYEDAKRELSSLLITAVKEQCISDVPLGAFLSGGIDSSLVCAIMKKHVKSQLQTFTIGMPAPGVNEAEHAAKVADFIGTEHTAKYLDTQEIIARIDEIISYWDEPFADSSQIPTFFVSELAKKSVTVSLSGDGADEFVYGYPDYELYYKFSKFAFIGQFGIDNFLTFFLKFKFFKKISIIRKASNLLYFLKSLSADKLGTTLLLWKNKFRKQALPINKNLLRYKSGFLNDFGKEFSYVGYYDVLDYLPNDILAKVDRAAMAVSLESRAPFLDHRVLEFIISLPTSYKYAEGTSKRILKDILYEYVPKEIVDRPKQGFSIPLTFWLRNNLKDWAKQIVNGIPEESNFWNKKIIVKMLNEHLEMEEDHTERLWNVLLLERFFERKKLEHHDI